MSRVTELVLREADTRCATTETSCCSVSSCGDVPYTTPDAPLWRCDREVQLAAVTQAWRALGYCRRVDPQQQRRCPHSRAEVWRCFAVMLHGSLLKDREVVLAAVRSCESCAPIC